MAYKFDIFLSYAHNPLIEKWITERFIPILSLHLEGSLNRKPLIFIDRDGIATGDSWPARLKESLATSRCLLCMWTPSYFQSKWCMHEIAFMLKREKQNKYRQTGKVSGLILPVTLSDGDNFPNFAKTIQYLDCRNFVIDGAAFEKTELYVDFQNRVRQWAPQVANAVLKAPTWKKKWLTDRSIKIPKIIIPPFGLPTLAE